MTLSDVTHVRANGNGDLFLKRFHAAHGKVRRSRIWHFYKLLLTIMRQVTKSFWVVHCCKSNRPPFWFLIGSKCWSLSVEIRITKVNLKFISSNYLKLILNLILHDLVN